MLKLQAAEIFVEVQQSTQSHLQQLVRWEIPKEEALASWRDAVTGCRKFKLNAVKNTVGPIEFKCFA